MMLKSPVGAAQEAGTPERAQPFTLAANTGDRVENFAPVVGCLGDKIPPLGRAPSIPSPPLPSAIGTTGLYG